MGTPKFSKFVGKLKANFKHTIAIAILDLFIQIIPSAKVLLTIPKTHYFFF